MEIKKLIHVNKAVKNITTKFSIGEVSLKTNRATPRILITPTVEGTPGSHASSLTFSG